MVGIWKVSQDDFRRIVVPSPPADERAAALELIAEAQSDIAAVIADVRQQTRRASALGQSILAAAFSGKLVPQARPTSRPRRCWRGCMPSDRAPGYWPAAVAGGLGPWHDRAHEPGPQPAP
jgi:hypothetical protein